MSEPRFGNADERRKAFWVERLSEVSPFEFPLDRARLPAPSYLRESLSRDLPAERWAQIHELAAACDVDAAAVLIGAYVLVASRTSGQDALWLGSVVGAKRGEVENQHPTLVALTARLVDTAPVRAFLRDIHASLAAVAAHALSFEIVAALAATRYSVPLFRTLVLPDGLRAQEDDRTNLSALGKHAAACDLVLRIETRGEGTQLVADHDPELFDIATVSALLAHMDIVIAGMAKGPDVSLASLGLITEEERRLVLATWNQTDVIYDHGSNVVQLIDAQVARTPDAVALRFGDEALTYRELNARANKLAHLLIEKGVRRDVLVGLCIERSTTMLVSVLAVLKAGGAYIPMDPDYPAKRIAYMVKDSGVRLVLIGTGAQNHGDAETLALDRKPEAGYPDSSPKAYPDARALAYVIYTSGSTGNPKGVMIEHRNVVNFFVGMDQRLGTVPGVWLAVTSLSFDISVLELLWTLTHGFEIVLFSARAAHAAPPRQHTAMNFGLFYFGSDEGDYAERTGRDKYKLLLDGARFADENGFSAVWTPERHFHSFGGLFPNPALAGAALAVSTKRISIRAGSVVLPINNPVRVAEEWALVDNFSEGRVEISFASGWQPQDFVFAPEAFAHRNDVMFEGIETVRALWRGEPRTLPGGDGKPVNVLVRPRPVQPELPIWITAGGSPETFRRAGALGANVLTHLLGQSLEQLAEKIALYRSAWREHGHSGDGGRVALMLHTFVAGDDASVRAHAYGALKSYLKGAVALFSPVAAAKGLDVSRLSAADLDALADHAFERYFQESGLFGTPDTCAPKVARMKAIGVDEIACLIDFGIPAEAVLAHLPYLDRLRKSAISDAQTTQPITVDHSIGALARRHNVTHLQCTPSMARMLVDDPETTLALSSLQQLMVGGEALSLKLATQLRKTWPTTTVTNMYGPTETTVWSMTHNVTDESGPVPIGRPIANTQVYLLDGSLNPVPPGVMGELIIAGDGVARGYLGRPKLTAERFVPDPFAAEPGRRMYRTGDLARHRRDGTTDFFGRLDHQVKLRGHRIELGEIEAALRHHPAVSEAVVVVREDNPDDQRLVAYLVARPGEKLAATTLEELRVHIKTTLTESMMPSGFVVLAALPLTPNGKIDRKALPAPNAAPSVMRPEVKPHSGAARPAANKCDEYQTLISDIWCEVLKTPKVGLHDNFFDLGGHSLLMVHVLNNLRGHLANRDGSELTMVDMFRFPTVQTLAEFLGNSASGAVPSALESAQGRAAARRRRLRESQDSGKIG